MILSYGENNLIISGEDPAFVLDSNYLTYKYLYTPFANINDEVSYLYSKHFGEREYSLKQIRIMGKPILPIYQQEIEAGNYQPFEFFEARHAPTPTQSAKLSRSIADTTGLDFLFVWNYLVCLEALAKAGKIDMKHYNPGLSNLKASTEKNIIDDTFEAIKNTPAAVSQFVENIGDPVDTASKRIVILAGIGLGGFALYTANKFIKRK